MNVVILNQNNSEHLLSSCFNSNSFAFQFVRKKTAKKNEVKKIGPS